jgi:isocitrate dehydrogenase kinase/phosphatase
MATDAAAESAARAALAAFTRFDAGFLAVTARAERRFAARDWEGAARDSAERLDLYESALTLCAAELRRRRHGSGRSAGTRR